MQVNMFKISTLLILTGVSLIVLSCAKEKNCLIGGLNLEIINLNDNEDDTIHVISFEKNGNFQDTINTRTYIFVDSLDSINQIQNNTVALNGGTTNFNGPDMNQTGFLWAEYDYKIVTKNHTYSFTNLAVLSKSKKCGGLLSLECPDCFSPVVQFNLNGENKQIAENEYFEIEN